METVTRFSEVLNQNQPQARRAPVIKKATNDADFPARTVETVDFIPGL